MKKENDLGRDGIGALVWRMALPSMLAQFVSVLLEIRFSGTAEDSGTFT